MSLPVIVIATAATCGHCRDMKGDGSLKPLDVKTTIRALGGQKWGWNETFFQKLLRGGAEKGPAKFRVYDIEITDLTNPMAPINEFSAYTLDKNGRVVRTTFYNKNGMVGTTSVTGYSSTKPSIVTTPKKYDELINTTIPNSIKNLFMAFPSFIFFDGSMWDTSIKSNSPLYGFIDGINVEKGSNGQFKAVPPPKNPQLDPVTNASKVIGGTLSLQYVPKQVAFEDTGRITAPTGNCESVKFILQPM